jgi:hypothetical protein
MYNGKPRRWGEFCCKARSFEGIGNALTFGPHLQRCVVENNVLEQFLRNHEGNELVNITPRPMKEIERIHIPRETFFLWAL